VQGGYRQLLCESQHAQVEDSNGPYEQSEPDEMQVHHERPPPLADEHQIGELTGGWFENMHDSGES
jgi:hypothetical protein